MGDHINLGTPGHIIRLHACQQYYTQSHSQCFVSFFLFSVSLLCFENPLELCGTYLDSRMDDLPTFHDQLISGLNLTCSFNSNPHLPCNLIHAKVLRLVCGYWEVWGGHLFASHKPKLSFFQFILLPQGNSTCHFIPLSATSLSTA